jgi:hypothetical protein
MALLAWMLLLLPLPLLPAWLRAGSEQCRRNVLWLYAFNFSLSGCVYLIVNHAFRQAAHVEKSLNILTGTTGEFTIQLIEGRGAAPLGVFFRDPQLATIYYLFLIMAGYAVNRRAKRRLDMM